MLTTEIWAYLLPKTERRDTRLLGSSHHGKTVEVTILKNCQASSKFEAVNSTWLSTCQRHVRPIFEMNGGLGLFLGSLQGTQTSFHLVI